MSRTSSPLFLSCLFWMVLASTSCHAEGTAPAPPARPAEASAQADRGTADLPSVTASNVQDVRSRVGQKLVLTGEVARVGSSGSGHRFINFTGNSELSVFISSSDVSKFQPDPPEQLYAGKSVAVTGQLERFNGKLQLQVRSPESIRIIEKTRGPPAPPTTKAPAPVELKSTGRDRWVSPAGLKYEGRDPDGNTRREHILRHAEDIPNRAGPHGVFDGGEELAFAWIDAAWEKIQKQKVKPETEAGRDVYTVDMGQRVGYLGGEAGQRRGNPALTKIFIVVRQGTTEVVTAFPK